VLSTRSCPQPRLRAHILPLLAVLWRDEEALAEAGFGHVRLAVDTPLQLVLEGRP
jgi:hypothetical protein